jgi:hypothetical protein
MTIPPEQQAEIVEPGDDSLQLDPVDQEDREWRLGFANMVEEGVLKVLCAVCRHCFCLAVSCFFLLNSLVMPGCNIIFYRFPVAHIP